jgi:O-methyltransferase domain
VNGIVFDSRHVVAGAEDAIREAGLPGRCRAVGGDFFESVPAGGDAYLMKHIIHDWPDDQATTILRNCRKGVNPGGKLLLVELVIAPGDAADLGKVIDLEMLVVASGKERTEVEYRQLLAGAGWRLTRVLPTKSPTQILEAEPV